MALSRTYHHPGIIQGPEWAELKLRNQLMQQFGQGITGIAGGIRQQLDRQEEEQLLNDLLGVSSREGMLDILGGREQSGRMTPLEKQIRMQDLSIPMETGLYEAMTPYAADRSAQTFEAQTPGYLDRMLQGFEAKQQDPQYQWDLLNQQTSYNQAANRETRAAEKHTERHDLTPQGIMSYIQSLIRQKDYVDFEGVEAKAIDQQIQFWRQELDRLIGRGQQGPMQGPQAGPQAGWASPTGQATDVLDPAPPVGTAAGAQAFGSTLDTFSNAFTQNMPLSQEYIQKTKGSDGFYHAANLEEAMKMMKQGIPAAKIKHQ